MKIREFSDFGNAQQVVALIREYIGTLPFDISNQRYEEELAHPSACYSNEAGGALFIAEENGQLAGCVAFKKLDAESCEMKRLFARPAFRGKNAGRALVLAAVEKAIKSGYRFMKLDTDRAAHQNAIAIYHSLGFREIPPYHEVPQPFLFLELDLNQYQNRNMNTHTEYPRKEISEDLAIIGYRPEFAGDFRRLNEAWISKSFFLEESDIAVLSDPEKYILAPQPARPGRGGAILLAAYKGKIAGTCALIDEGNDVYELTKMAVDEELRGLKIGWHLGVATLDLARQLGARQVILHSNRKGSAIAIELYRKLGFVEIPLGNAPWARADIKMQIGF